MNRIHDMILPSHCAIPPTNPTAPTEASSLSIRNTLDGGLHASFNEPVTLPRGTRYQLVRSTSSVDASVGTVVWDGTAVEVDFAAPNSAHWYWIRGYANNSYYGPYSPNTYGVFGAARYPVSDLLRVVGDPEFEKSTAIGSHWSTAYTSIFSIAPTGGINGGLARLSLSSMDLTAAAVRVLFGTPIAPYAKWDNGYQFTAFARIRRTATFSWDTAVTSFFTFQISAFAWDGTNTPVWQEIGGGGNCRGFVNSNAYYGWSDINSWNANEWRDIQANLVMTSSGNNANFAHATSYPYWCVGFVVPGSRPRTGALEIDLLGVQL